jgi:hypothetical protein
MAEPTKHRCDVPTPIQRSGRVIRGPDASLRDLVDVIGVGRSVQVGSATLTLLSLERYMDGFVAQFRLAQTYELPHSATDLTFPELICQAADDRGGSHTPWPHGGSGGDAGQGISQWRIAFR